MFSRVLIANRGEIARRIIRTLDALGIESVAVYSEGDADAPHVREATRAVCIGPDPATSSYLKTRAIIEAALTSGAEAIHPGYGFLSESAEFARVCAESGIVFIGPGTHALEVMGDKVRARHHLAGAGVPMVPGFADVDASGEALSEAEVGDRAEQIGLPLLIKPSAGGGGKGMEVVRSVTDLPQALASARRLATASFGDDTLLLERLIERPRHIEIQVFGSVTGEMFAFGERECTLQRRHQKVIEESPNAGGIAPETIEALSLAAVRAASSVSYVGAGTVEFLVDADRPEEFFFIEMNTRLQVEHPVTEKVLGLDLVELQVLTAAGEDIGDRLRREGHHLIEVSDPDTEECLGWRLTPTGHAIEARIYAETPERGFLPSVGAILWWQEPQGARVDAAVEQGGSISASYDPMIAKVITHAATRAEALTELDRALAETEILGVDTNVCFLRALVTDTRVQAGHLDTGLIDSLLPWEATKAPDDVLDEVALAFTDTKRTARHGASDLWHSRQASRAFSVRRQHSLDESLITLIDDAETEYQVSTRARDERSLAPRGTVVHRNIPVAVEYTDEHRGQVAAVWAATEGSSWRFRHLTRRQLTLRSLPSEQATGSAHCEAPMPGTVTRLHVENGARVEAGDALVSIEAMKMEHPTLAPHAGIARIYVAAGDRVRRGQELASVEQQEETS